MTPNPVETSFNNELESADNRKEHITPLPAQVSQQKYLLYYIQGVLNVTAYVLSGVVVGVSILYAVCIGIPLNPVSVHIVLCCLGYQLLMAVAMLALTSESGFSARLSLKDKRRLHTVLQVVGSVLAIAGNVIMSQAKNINFNTLHGKFGLVAFVFTTVSVVNGFTSLYAYELRKCLPGNLSKLTHICFGVVTFTMAAVSLCYGFHKNAFRNWASDEFTLAIIIMTAIFTFICIINPFITFFNKTYNIVNK